LTGGTVRDLLDHDIQRPLNWDHVEPNYAGCKPWLVGGDLMKVNGKDYPIYEMENKKMFQTTNQMEILIGNVFR